MKDLKIFTNNIEDTAKEQINLLLEQEAFKDCKVRIMPDVHSGKGCVIGFTANLGDKVIPNIVGVDIGCGMLCVELGKIDLDLKKLDEIIRKVVPSGREVHEEEQIDFDFYQLNCFQDIKDYERIKKSLGTLGGGNHFIEVDEDEEGNKYLIIHTGSRNLGNQVAELYQSLAIQQFTYSFEMKEEKKHIIEKYKAENRQSEIQKALNLINLKYQGKVKMPEELCYLEGGFREDYLHDMKICQIFAMANREKIMENILNEYGKYCGKGIQVSYFHTIHNYIDFKDNIVRKGAISAKKGERVIIPINMRDGCIIAIGKGNDDWNQSAPHGAGRVMSRMKAKEELKMQDYKDTMKDIYSTSINENTIDEAPMAYKPMQEIINNIKDTVEIERIIKPIYNFKASN